MLEKRPADPATAFGEVAEEQEGESFDAHDPPGWHYPVRRDLAEALFAAGVCAGARREAQAALANRAKDAGTLALLKTFGAEHAVYVLRSYLHGGDLHFHIDTRGLGQVR